jgi:hypothetical protein
LFTQGAAKLIRFEISELTVVAALGAVQSLLVSMERQLCEHYAFAVEFFF